MQKGFISETDFDWKYYLEQNPDLGGHGIRGSVDAYRHWITHGCHENRLVKTLTGQPYRLQLKISEKLNLRPTHNTPINEPFHLEFRMAIMIHIFDLMMLKTFIIYLNDLFTRYRASSFDVYINFVVEDNPYGKGVNQEQLIREYVVEQLKTLMTQNVKCLYSPNRGGDIGGFFLLSREVRDSLQSYRYAIFVHSKNKKKWRIDLCQCVFNLRYETLGAMTKMGIISHKNWIKTFDPLHQVDEYNRFKYHLIELSRIYQLDHHQPWSFVAGTMFLFRIEILEYIVNHELDSTYLRLNQVNSVDVNWVSILDSLGIDRKNTTNDYQYRLTYARSLRSDYMIEHTFERVIGLICQHLGFQVTHNSS
jgi:hypothetical protein